jgi:hypothetical protein
METLFNDEPNLPIWKSYVWYDEHCYFVSTIERNYDTCQGTSRGQETLVWEYDWENRIRGKLIHQSGNVQDHQIICRCIIALGEIPDEDNPRHSHFFE